MTSEVSLQILLHRICWVNFTVQKTLTSGTCRMELPLSPCQVEVATSAAEPLPAELRSHGSKLLAVARRLQKIRAEDAKAKAIVFVQWQELENKAFPAVAAGMGSTWGWHFMKKIIVLLQKYAKIGEKIRDTSSRCWFGHTRR